MSKRDTWGIAKSRRVTAVFYDHSSHSLKLVETRATVRWKGPAEDNKLNPYRVDASVEAEARTRIMTDDDDLSFMGVLVAELNDQQLNGRITWGELVDTSEAVEV